MLSPKLIYIDDVISHECSGWGGVGVGGLDSFCAIIKASLMYLEEIHKKQEKEEHIDFYYIQFMYCLSGCTFEN